MCRPALALAVVLCLALACSADKGWSFQGVKSKQEAKARASGLASLDLSDNGPDNGKVKDMFDDWVATYNMSFTSNQASKKALKAFKANLKQIRDVNLDDSATWWASGNQFTGLSSDDFAATYLMAPGSTQVTGPVDTWTPPSAGRKLHQTATKVNWVTAGKVTPIKNQGACGSCWAFAATSVLESMYLMKVGGNASKLSLSEQQVVSCTYTRDGCQGGSSYTALQYVYNSKQSVSSLYPYVSGSSAVGGTCNSALISALQAGQYVKPSAGPKGLSPTSTESTFLNSVALQPTVIYFAVASGWQHYYGGIFNASMSGCAASVNHAMVAVGYDITNPSARYWNIRNSWGTGWGEQGYARVLMTGNGAGPCGMYQVGYVPQSGFSSVSLTNV